MIPSCRKPAMKVVVRQGRRGLGRLVLNVTNHNCEERGNRGASLISGIDALINFKTR